jgi:hypothetical protein
VVRIVQHYRTLDMREIHRRLVDDINAQSDVPDLASDEQPRIPAMEQTKG